MSCSSPPKYVWCLYKRLTCISHFLHVVKNEGIMYYVCIYPFLYDIIWESNASKTQKNLVFCNLKPLNALSYIKVQKKLIVRMEFVSIPLAAQHGAKDVWRYKTTNIGATRLYWKINFLTYFMTFPSFCLIGFLYC